MIYTPRMLQQKRTNIEIVKLKNALAYAEAIIEAIHEPLLVLHPDLRVRSANKAFYINFHLSSEQVENREIYQVNNGEWDIPELKFFFKQILASNKSIKDFELKQKFKKIGSRALLLNGQKLLMEGEVEPMILLVIEDITVRKKYEAQIKKDKDIVEENLRLQEISRQKDDFISMASHELKTPVTSIKAFAQLLQNDFTAVGDVQAATMLSKMNFQIVKLTSLIGDLLDVSRMEGGKLQYHLDYFCFNEMIVETVREVQLTSKSHKITVDLVKVPRVYGDEDRLSQVLTNLLSNAIKYSPRSRNIELFSSLENGLIAVMVRDHGIGIRKEKQAKLFQRFFRVNGAKEDTYPGLGLGLYISSEIIKRHNGIIGLKSIKGKGSTFYFKIPVNKAISSE
ncbi:MAG: ATP-binding protein [Ginsengibacter sp.]